MSMASTGMTQDVGDTSARGGGGLRAVPEAQQYLWVAAGGAAVNEEVAEVRHLQR